MAFEGVSQVTNPVFPFVNALNKIIVCKYGWLLVALKNWQDEIHDKRKQIYEKRASLSCLRKL
jgi:hypothetical protein